MQRGNQTPGRGTPPPVRMGLELYCERTVDIWDKEKERYEKVRCGRKLSIYNRPKIGEAKCYEHKEPDRRRGRSGLR